VRTGAGYGRRGVGTLAVVWRRAGLVTVALAVVGACSAGDDDVAAPITVTTLTTAAVAAAAVPAALDFSAPRVGGGELDARSYAGRNLALWFWAPY
jgi:hypothetical protein